MFQKKGDGFGAECVYGEYASTRTVKSVGEAPVPVLGQTVPLYEPPRLNTPLRLWLAVVLVNSNTMSAHELAGKLSTPRFVPMLSSSEIATPGVDPTRLTVMSAVPQVYPVGAVTAGLYEPAVVVSKVTMTFFSPVMLIALINAELVPTFAIRRWILPFPLAGSK